MAWAEIRRCDPALVRPAETLGKIRLSCCCRDRSLPARQRGCQWGRLPKARRAERDSGGAI
ncbi:hypothetical protein MPLA_1650039 [Mesorhizobium sp. ORS 3359]|nr:hypothetical protein MPLA_1650039 [Mesorhizobium sp. ORS 3359]